MRVSFDKISHEFLLKKLGNFPAKELIRKWLETGYIEYGQTFLTTCGTGQGACISPLLCNIALDGMEQALGIRYYSDGRIIGNRTVIRYADDFICLANTESEAYKCKEILTSWLRERGLEFSQEKTQVVHLEQGFDFLGVNIRRYENKNNKSGYKLLIKPSKKSINKIRAKLRSLWKSLRGNNVGQVIRQINPVIRGWANYHKANVASKTFGSLDHWMYSKAYKWCKYSHSNKGIKWRIERYWGKLNPNKPEDKWVFGDKRTSMYMLKFASFAIQHHIMVKGKASPDDPQLQEYWDKRRKGYTKLLSKSKYKIAKKQGHKCPVCGDYLINGEELEADHIEPSGGDKYSNLQLLHSYCHKQKTYKQQRNKLNKANLTA